MKQLHLSGGTLLTAVGGDLTKQETDAIVNAANPALLGGGGVDGAIHRAAGPELLEACRALVEVAPRVRCPTGEARITPGFRLPSRYVIHTVGPIYARENDPESKLRTAHHNSLLLAVGHQLRSVAFPAISCGVYGYPLHEAAHIAVQVAREFDGQLDEIRFVLFGDPALDAWSAELA